MSEKLAGHKEKEQEFNKMLVGEYLKYGSVDEVYRRHNYCLPISYPGFQRLLDKWGIVKSAGPNSTLSEALSFMTILSENTLPLETMYRKMPPSFKTSMATMHRIFHNIKEGVIRREGTALVVSAGKDKYRVLIANDISTPRLNLGKPYGSVSFPMTFSKRGEDPEDSIKRVLQQEVFVRDTIEGKLPVAAISSVPKPFMHFEIADIGVNVFHIHLPEHFFNFNVFSSYKLKDFRFVYITDILSAGAENKNFRSGMKEITRGYKNYLEGADTFFQKANLNIELARLAPEILKSY